MIDIDTNAVGINSVLSRVQVLNSGKVLSKPYLSLTIGEPQKFGRTKKVTRTLVLGWKAADSRPVWKEIARYGPNVKAYWAQRWNLLDVQDDLLDRALENEGRIRTEM